MSFISNLKYLSTTNRIAAFDGTKELSFKNLWLRSEAIGVFLQKNGKRGKPVAIYGDKENDMLSCIFGALKSGRPYVIIPSYYPEERVKDIIEDCDCDFILQMSKDKIPYDNRIILTSSDIDNFLLLYEGEEAAKDFYPKSQDTCFILYTSGSTGTPKGVMITSNNIKAKIDWCKRYISPHYPSAGGKILNLPSYGFSASISNIYYAMATLGCTLYGVPRTMLGDYGKLLKYFICINPHVINCTPSFLSNLLTFPDFYHKNFSNLSFLCSGGEPLSINIASEVMVRFPDTCLANGYGCTETIAGPLICTISKELIEKSPNYLPVGIATESTNTYLVNDYGIVSQDEVLGELIITGEFVSSGYFNKGILTKEAFFTTEAGERAYRTKDLMYKKDDLYYFTGRKDNQIKIGGNRVEIEDVEANLRKVEIIKDCAAITVQDKNGINLIVAYVVLHDETLGKMKAIINIKTELKKLIQPYMIPQKILFTKELPKNINLKIDRIALQKLYKERYGGYNYEEL